MVKKICIVCGSGEQIVGVSRGAEETVYYCVEHYRAVKRGKAVAEMLTATGYGQCSVCRGEQGNVQHKHVCE